MSPLVPGHDLRLARRAAAGLPDAWRQIVDGFGPRIHALALHFCRDRARAEDLTQEIFLRLFQNLGSYRGDVPLLAWTLRLSRNLCIDDYRRHRPERAFRFLPLASAESLSDGSNPAGDAQSRELLTEVEAALAELDPETATMLTLRDVEGFSYRELEELFELPAGTVKSRLHRGRRELLRRLEQRRLRWAGGGVLKVAPC